MSGGAPGAAWRAGLAALLLCVAAACAGVPSSTPTDPDAIRRVEAPEPAEGARERARALVAEALDALAVAHRQLLRGAEEPGRQALQSARERVAQARELLPRATFVLPVRRGEPVTVRGALEPLELPADTVGPAVLEWLRPLGGAREGRLRVDLDALATRLERTRSASVQGALAELFLAADTSVELIPAPPPVATDADTSLWQATSEAPLHETVEVEAEAGAGG